MRVEVALYVPVPRVLPPRAVAEPFRVNPVIIHGQIVRDDLLDISEMVRRGRPAPVVVCDRRKERPASGRWPVMRQDELAKQVVATPSFAPPEKRQDARCADLFPGVELQV